MRWLRIAIAAAALLCWATASADLDTTATDGWHTWSIENDEAEQVHFFVLVENGKPARIHSMNWNCRRPTKDRAVDHGRIAAAESYEWFRVVVENHDVERDIRDAALFGLVESDSEEAIAYIDGILSRRKGL